MRLNHILLQPLLALLQDISRKNIYFIIVNPYFPSFLLYLVRWIYKLYHILVYSRNLQILYHHQFLQFL